MRWPIFFRWIFYMADFTGLLCFDYHRCAYYRKGEKIEGFSTAFKEHLDFLWRYYRAYAAYGLCADFSKSVG